VFALLVLALTSLMVSDELRAEPPQNTTTRLGKIADKPLFRDPTFDGAADPVVIWNRRERKWFMLYTNRRANVKDTTGVEWVHGTRIGIAESTDAGASWKYKGVADIDYGSATYTYWAPDVVYHGSTYHMYLTVVPGIFKDWNATRHRAPDKQRPAQMEVRVHVAARVRKGN
jgi:hypothetical protein